MGGKSKVDFRFLWVRLAASTAAIRLDVAGPLLVTAAEREEAREKAVPRQGGSCLLQYAE